MNKLLLLVLPLLAYAPLSSADGAQPLELLTNVVKNLNSTVLCSHSCDTVTWTRDDGCLFISFQTELTADDLQNSINKADAIGKLCFCMINYMNQNNWLDGVTPNCGGNDGNTVTLTFTGQPNANYDANAPTQQAPQPPLKALGDVIRNFPNAELGGCQCRPVVTEDAEGSVTIKIECDLTPTSKYYEDVCDDILAYLNQNSWLDNSTNECSLIDSETLLLELFG